MINYQSNRRSLWAATAVIAGLAFLLAVMLYTGLQAKNTEASYGEDIKRSHQTVNQELSPSGIDTILFLHTNDRHFDLNLTEEFSAVISGLRERYNDVFLFDAGDLFVRHPNRWIVNGTPKPDYEWYSQRAHEMIASLNDQRYDAVTLGNHELAYIQPYTLNALQTAQMPLLAANMEITTPHLPPVKDYVILKSKNGIRIAVLGLSVDNARFMGVKQKDIFQTAQDYMMLRDSAHIFLALTHIGLNNDRQLASRFPQLDLIIGGHSHDLLKETLLVNDVLIAHAGGNPHVVSDRHPVLLGKVFVRLENGHITHRWGEVIEITGDY
jgi:2',3'-cyclic-nucleotide 2'-phosphodiesterase (5'-nucleotidase family)